MAGCGSGEDSEGCGILSRLSDCDWKLGSMRGMSHILRYLHQPSPASPLPGCIIHRRGNPRGYIQDKKWLDLPQPVPICRCHILWEAWQRNTIIGQRILDESLPLLYKEFQSRNAEQL